MKQKMGAGCGRMGEEARGLRSTNRWLPNSHGDVQYSTGNGVAKELVRMINGHEQGRGDCWRKWELPGGGGKRGKIEITVIA